MRTPSSRSHLKTQAGDPPLLDKSFCQSDMCIIVGIASAGRPDILNQTVSYLQTMTNQPDAIVVCVPDMSHAGDLATNTCVELLTGQRGLTIQRNRILASAAGRADILVFLDDDFIPSPDFFIQMKKSFSENPDIAIATGHVLADGILSGGLELRQALDIIRVSRKPDSELVNTYNAYGCNMALRMSIVVTQGLRFDERLPLYGWLEDVDFSRLIARFGQSVQVKAARGVHLGVKSGRQPGNRLGYSQIANPYYLSRKGTMSVGRAFVQATMNLTANVTGLVRGDKDIDRRGRFRGNLLALGDIIKGTSSPERILEITPQFAQSAAGSSTAKQEVER